MPLLLSPKQKDYYRNANAKINISHGAVRSGKTFVTNLKWLEYIRYGPPGTLLMSGRTKQSLKENVLDPLFEIVGKQNYYYRESTGELIMFGRKIKCTGADDINAEKVIRGRTYAGWYGDEITIQHPSFVRQAITRCSVPGARIYWTTNPDHPRHEIKVKFIDNKEMRRKGQVKVWHFLFEDNLTLTQDYIDMQKAAFSGVFYKRNILGLWVLAEGVVYGDDYNPEIHKVPRATIKKMIRQKAFKEYIGGVDFGSTHPMVGLVIGVTRDNKYYLIDEFYKTNARTEQLAKFFLKWEKALNMKFFAIFCDSAEPDRIVTLQVEGLKATGVNKKDKSAQINTVQVTFKMDRLFISEEDCPNTDIELQTYRYPDPDEEPTKAKKDEPLDEDDHAMDALRYAIHTYERYLMRLQRDEERKARKARARHQA